jgi:hypothetical protein
MGPGFDERIVVSVKVLESPKPPFVWNTFDGCSETQKRQPGESFSFHVYSIVSLEIYVALPFFVSNSSFSSRETSETLLCPRTSVADFFFAYWDLAFAP